MTEGPNLPIRHDPAVEEARRVAFLIGEAEHRLGINNDHLPLSARLQMVLQGAMDNPRAVDPGTFAVIYKLAAVPFSIEGGPEDRQP